MPGAMGVQGLQTRPGALLSAVLEGTQEDFGAFQTFPAAPGWLWPCPPSLSVSERSCPGGARLLQRRFPEESQLSQRVQHVSVMELMCCVLGWSGILIHPCGSEGPGCCRGWERGALPSLSEPISCFSPESQLLSACNRAGRGKWGE